MTHDKRSRGEDDLAQTMSHSLSIYGLTTCANQLLALFVSPLKHRACDFETV